MHSTTRWQGSSPITRFEVFREIIDRIQVPLDENVKVMIEEFAEEVIRHLQETGRSNTTITATNDNNDSRYERVNQLLHDHGLKLNTIHTEPQTVVTVERLSGDGGEADRVI